MKSLRALALLAGLSLLAACDKDKDVEPPAELVDIRASIGVERLWSTSLGGGGEKLRLALDLASDGQSLFAASRGGEVHSFSLDDGKQRWKVDTDVELAAGPGAADGLVVVGTNDGDVVALDAADGKQRWRVKVSGEVLATPLVAGEIVVVRTVDGRLRGLSAADGSEKWLLEEQVPRLSLRGTASPVLSGDVILCGFDTGKVSAVALATGDLLWSTQVSTPRGRTELERLADVDAAVRVSGDDVYAVGFQGRVAMLAKDTGQVWWGRDLSSYRGLALDEDRLYVSSSEGSVVAVARRDGSAIWQQDGLRRRILSAPAIDGGGVVVGDFEGYLHWLSRDTGEFVARERPGGARISAAPLVVNGNTYVLDDEGKLVAYRAGGAAGR
jgi:outer membrane protein assembly factor BamB